MSATLIAEGARVRAIQEPSLPPPVTEALMPGATVVPLQHGMARLVDDERGMPC